MNKVLFALLFVCSTAQAIGGDSYIDSPQGKIILFALPGCWGVPATIWGMIERSDGTGDLLCWKYDNEERVHVYLIDSSHLTFLLSDVKTEGATEDTSPSFPYPPMRLDRLSMLRP
ncbi:MAG: hypothetical protein ACYC2E_04625 [Sulfuricella sp.]